MINEIVDLKVGVKASRNISLLFLFSAKNNLEKMEQFSFSAICSTRKKENCWSFNKFENVIEFDSLLLTYLLELRWLSSCLNKSEWSIEKKKRLQVQTDLLN